MSSNVTDPTAESTPSTAADTTNVTSPNSKGKGKAPTTDHPMNEDAHEAEEEDDEEEEEEGEEEDDDDEEDEETYDEIDPTAIVSGRRTRGVRVDYTSKEALEKAGLKPEEADEDEDEDVVMG